MKTYGLTVYAPLHWPIERHANGNRQIRVVARVRSKRELLDILHSHGLNVTAYQLRDVCTTGNAAELAAAAEHPHTLLRHEGDRWSDQLVVAERLS